MKTMAIIPARAGSKGLPDKNIRKIAGIPLIGYSINFANALGCDEVFCSTDSKEYAKIAENYGAKVPFLRSKKASGDNSMEEDILRDLYYMFQKLNLEIPQIIVWLRPTFVFRDINLIKKGLNILIKNPDVSSVRTVCESESRLYSIKNGVLIPCFDDFGRSMIKRQDMEKKYKVFSTDIFRVNLENDQKDFLGRNIIPIPINKICGLDIDDEVDFKLVESLINHSKDLVDEYLF